MVRFQVNTDVDLGTTSVMDSEAIVRSYRRRVQQIIAASDERVFYALKSLHYEKLKGTRAGDRSIRLNRQWRLVLAIGSEEGKPYVQIKKIEDYH